MSGGIHLSGIGLGGQHSSKETLQQCQVVGGIVSDLTSPRKEPKTFRADSDVFTHKVNQPVSCTQFNVLLMFRLKMQASGLLLCWMNKEVRNLQLDYVVMT